MAWHGMEPSHPHSYGQSKVRFAKELEPSLGSKEHQSMALPSTLSNNSQGSATQRRWFLETLIPSAWKGFFGSTLQHKNTIESKTTKK
jgi:hypothetical protein